MLLTHCHCVIQYHGTASQFITRMVQLPATAAIEYVAACLPGGSFSPGVFWPGGLCPSPQVQCVYEPSRLSVPSIVP